MSTPLNNHFPALDAVPRHFAAVTESPLTRLFLDPILRICRNGGTACEQGAETGYASIWLSQRGVDATGDAGAASGFGGLCDLHRAERVPAGRPGPRP